MRGGKCAFTAERASVKPGNQIRQHGGKEDLKCKLNK